ncbi:hypothetical protein ASD85_27620 [Rhizobium sp. Root651]|jgi:hypothetical protein|nr:hypothetical protein ASD85_27620 [Rhizobium sp. Root651]
MSLSDFLKAGLSVIAATLLVIGLFATAPAFAAPTHHCPEVQASDQVLDSQRDGLDVQLARTCCAQMHCCPILPQPLVYAPPEVPFGQLHVHVRPERPLLLLTAIDPPPRTPAV